ncbi:MAG: gamma-glutamyl-gamma-aminobutyrate hydrolase family protein [Caulobacteraceae bacterium]
MKPVILITSNHESEGGRSKTTCNWHYINSVAICGGLPLVLPNIDTGDNIDSIMRLADGILFSGGADVHPKYFNEEIKVDNMTICERRDSFEMSLAERVLASDMPVLGICRGMQLLNIAAGGNIYQDIGAQYKTSIKHSNPESPRWEIIHKVKPVENSKYYGLYSAAEKGVNSFHHQAVKDLASGFKVSAYSEDGLIEAYEADGERFLFGIQWHPEGMAEKYPEELELFRQFIKSANKYKSQKAMF